MNTEFCPVGEPRQKLVKMDMERFVKILAIELEYLCEHIELIVDDFTEKGRTHQVREHVCYGNVAVLKNEETACHRFAHDVLNLSINDFASLDDLEAAIRRRLHRLARTAGFAPASLLLADKKIRKVARYIRESA